MAEPKLFNPAIWSYRKCLWSSPRNKEIARLFSLVWHGLVLRQRLCRFYYLNILFDYKIPSAKAFRGLICIVSFSQKLLQSQLQKWIPKPDSLSPSQWLLQQAAVAKLHPASQGKGCVCRQGWWAGSTFPCVTPWTQSAPGRGCPGADGAVRLWVRLQHGHQWAQHWLRAHGADELLWERKANRN